MAVFRIKKPRDYTVMSNHHPRNWVIAEIQRAALHDAVFAGGLELHHQRPCKNLQGGHGDSIGSSLKKLEHAGYTVSNRLRGSKGKIIDMAYVIYETPHPMDTDQPCEDESDTSCSDTENPDINNPCLENRPQLNKEEKKS